MMFEEKRNYTRYPGYDWLLPRMIGSGIYMAFIIVTKSTGFTQWWMELTDIFVSIPASFIPAIDSYYNQILAQDDYTWHKLVDDTQLQAISVRHIFGVMWIVAILSLPKFFSKFKEARQFYIKRWFSPVKGVFRVIWVFLKAYFKVLIAFFMSLFCCHFAFKGVELGVINLNRIDILAPSLIFFLQDCYSISL